MRVWFHSVVTRKFHPVFPQYLTVRKLHIVIVIAPCRKTTCIVLEKVKHVSIFDLKIEARKNKTQSQEFASGKGNRDIVLVFTVNSVT